jgi:hypothetical protein
MPRVLIGWLLIVHAIAHAFAGLWASSTGSIWTVTFLWAIASIGYMAAGLGVLRAPWLRRVWKRAFIAATLASILFIAWYSPPWSAPGPIIDLFLLIEVLGIEQPGIDSDIDVVDQLGADALPHPVFERIAWGIGFAAIAYSAVVLTLRPVSMRWGSTSYERVASLPGDSVHPMRARYRIDHAITINAPASAVWPWLVQLGQDRGGFYSYDWLERGVGARIRNADRIHPEWQRRALGDTVFATQRDYLGGRFGGLGWRVNALVPERVIGLENWGTFVLQPVDDRTTRLIVRTRGTNEPSASAFLLAPLNVFVFEPMHFIMERGMLRGIRDRAERVAAPVGQSTTKKQPTHHALQALPGRKPPFANRNFEAVG